MDKLIIAMVIGCTVNGPGEASATDADIVGSNGEDLFFRRGEIVKEVPQRAPVDEFFALIEEL